MVNFPTRIPDCDSHSAALLDFFLSSGASIVLFAEIFSLNSNLDDSGVSLLVFPSRTNLKVIIFL